MKKETINQANNLLERIEANNEFRDKVTLSENPDRPSHLYSIKTIISRYNNNNKEFSLLLEKDGSTNINFVSDKGKAILAHAAETYFKSLQSVFDSEISRLQKELDNLKDE